MKLPILNICMQSKPWNAACDCTMNCMKDLYRKIHALFILCSYVLILPLMVIVVFSRLSLPGDMEKWDRQAQAVVISCTDVTHRTKGEYENGGPSLTYESKAAFELDGKTYDVTTRGGKNYRIGSTVVISYNSQDPEDNYWSENPGTEKSRMSVLHLGSCILTLLTFLGIFRDLRRKKQKMHKKE